MLFQLAIISQPVAAQSVGGREEVLFGAPVEYRVLHCGWECGQLARARRVWGNNEASPCCAMQEGVLPRSGDQRGIRVKALQKSVLGAYCIVRRYGRAKEQVLNIWIELKHTKGAVFHSSVAWSRAVGQVGGGEWQWIKDKCAAKALCRLPQCLQELYGELAGRRKRYQVIKRVEVFGQPRLEGETVAKPHGANHVASAISSEARARQIHSHIGGGLPHGSTRSCPTPLHGQQAQQVGVPLDALVGEELLA
mmetsp:Transcript_84266/g.212478  ORF Transcript_84266/g.212478 Transcript_84266/m.212478 type:complete len:251 (-) Transcript_84266:1520-2272(-)